MRTGAAVASSQQRRSVTDRRRLPPRGSAANSTSDVCDEREGGKNLYVMCARRKRADPYRIASHSDMGACVHIQRKAESGITFSALFHTVSRERRRLFRNIIFQVDGWIVDPGSGGDSFATAAAASAAAAAERLGGWRVEGWGESERKCGGIKKMSKKRRGDGDEAGGVISRRLRA